MYHLDSTTKEKIIEYCKKYHAERVILFGSRARGDNQPFSDIDLAIEGCEDFDRLFADLKYNEFTLLDMDIINLNDKLNDALLQDIRKDGCILYEKGCNHESQN